MSFFPADMPKPAPNMDDQAFWDHCAEGRLCFQACGDCGTPRHPPTPICGHCYSSEVKWVDASPDASVYSFTVVHHASHPAVAGSLPYVAATVEFAGIADVRLITNLTDVDPKDVRIGMPVTLWWDKLDDGMQIPRFRPRP